MTSVSTAAAVRARRRLQRARRSTSRAAPAGRRAAPGSTTCSCAGCRRDAARGLAARASRVRWRGALRSRAGRGDGRMTPAEARALFPVLERLAYLNAGTFGPLAQPTADAMQARSSTTELEPAAAGKEYFERVLDAAGAGCGRALAALVGAAAEQVALTGVDDGRLQHRPRRARPRAGRRGRDDRRRALRPARPAARVAARASSSRDAGAGRDPGRGDAAHAPARPLAGALDDRPRAAGARAARADRRSGARRRRAVGRRDPRRRGGPRLPDDLRARSGSAARTRPARSSSPTRSGCASRGRATSRRPPTRPTGAFEPRDGRAPASTPTGSRRARWPGWSPRSTSRRSGASSGPRSRRAAAASCSRRSSSSSPATRRSSSFRSEEPTALVARSSTRASSSASSRAPTSSAHPSAGGRATTTSSGSLAAL